MGISCKSSCDSASDLITTTVIMQEIRGERRASLCTGSNAKFFSQREVRFSHRGTQGMKEAGDQMVGNRLRGKSQNLGLGVLLQPEMFFLLAPRTVCINSVGIQLWISAPILPT